MLRILLPLPRASSGSSREREDEQVAGGGDGGEQVILEVAHRLGRQRLGALGHGDHRLARVVAGVEVARGGRRSRSRRRWRAARRSSSSPIATPTKRGAGRRVDARDSGSPWPRAEGRVWPAGCRCGRSSRGRPPAGCCLPAGGVAGSRRRTCRRGPRASTSCPLAARTQPLSERTTVTGSDGSSSASSRALAAASARPRAASGGRRRRSRRRPRARRAPGRAGVFCEPSDARELVALRASARPARRGSSSPRAWRGGAAWSRGSPRPGASVSSKRAISTGLGSSSVRMMRITSSMLR